MLFQVSSSVTICTQLVKGFYLDVDNEKVDNAHCR